MAISDDKTRVAITLPHETVESIDALAKELYLARAAAVGLLVEFHAPATARGVKLLAAKLRRHRERELYDRQAKAAARL